MSPVTRKLSSDAQPEYHGTPADFRDHLDSEKYWGEIPIEYFTVTRDTVTMNAKLASALDWILYETHGNTWTIAATTQRIELDGTTYRVNPGAFPALIHDDHVPLTE